jgi:hypothetical protein
LGPQQHRQYQYQHQHQHGDGGAACTAIETVQTAVVPAATAVVGVPLAFKLDPATSPLLDPGQYAIAVVALSATNLSQTVGPPDYHNITKFAAAAPPLVVEVDAQRRIVSKGKPLFPIGMYASSLNESDYKRFGETNVYNLLMPYGQQNVTQLDWAVKHGMQVAYSIKDDFCGHALKCNSSADEEAVVKKKLTEFRDHPAVLVWCVCATCKLVQPQNHAPPWML